MGAFRAWRVVFVKQCAILLSPFMAVVRTFAPFVGGTAAMTSTRYLSAGVAGAAIWVMTLVAGGCRFGNAPIVRDKLSSLVPLGVVIGVVALVVSGVYRFFKQLRYLLVIRANHDDRVRCPRRRVSPWKAALRSRRISGLACLWRACHAEARVRAEARSKELLGDAQRSRARSWSMHEDVDDDKYDGGNAEYPRKHIFAHSVLLESCPSRNRSSYRDEMPQP